MTTPVATPPEASGRPFWRSREPVWQMIVAYGALTLMASGDAYGFYSVLIGLFMRDSFLVLLVILALTLGAVLGAHEIGRLARSRREGGDGSVWWIMVLAMIWLAVGGSIMWLRAVRPLGTDDDAVAGVAELQIALLLFGLYLLTGALAMTAAYRFGNPRITEMRALLRERQRATREASEAHLELGRNQALLEHLRTERQRYDEQHQDNSDLPAAFAEYVNEEATLRVAQRIGGGPVQTDGVLRPPRNP
ncbi:MAG: hypothetical protein ACRDRX_11230 [Pseudonocardiaceae bacterium]